MAFVFDLPEVGEGVVEAEVVAWHVNVGDVVAFLKTEYEPFGIEVYEGAPKVPDTVVFERIYLSNVNIQQVISFLNLRSDELVFSAVTPAGICIGSKKACGVAGLVQQLV